MTATQKKALAALMTCSTKKEAAEQAGISERTMRAYLADPEFKAAYRKECDDLLEAAAIQIKQAITPAVEALQEIIKNPGNPPSVRVAAARAVLDNAVKLSESVDLTRRVQEVEDKAAQDEWF